MGVCITQGMNRCVTLCTLCSPLNLAATITPPSLLPPAPAQVGSLRLRWTQQKLGFWISSHHNMTLCMNSHRVQSLLGLPCYYLSGNGPRELKWTCKDLILSTWSCWAKSALMGGGQGAILGDAKRLKFLLVHANIHANTLTFHKNWIFIKSTVFWLYE